MQIYADILGKPLKVSASEQTCALGAAIFGAVASGRVTLADAQANCCQVRDHVYEPIPENQAIYERLYALYRTLHDAFGTSGCDGKLDRVMKEVIAIRAESRSSS